MKTDNLIYYVCNAYFHWPRRTKCDTKIVYALTPMKTLRPLQRDVKPNEDVLKICFSRMY